MFDAKTLLNGYKYEMEHKGFRAVLKRANRLPDNGSVHNLPPGWSVPVYPVDALPGCPEDWPRGGGNYVCPVEPNWGLWFDWTMNDTLNTAILPSVKGMNPITGLKMDGLALAEYKDKCPVHDKAFSEGRLCESCGYRWPAQSFLSDPNTLWWDGFRQPDGTVRQFFFTEDMERDIASCVIGKENVVPAFGFAFYETVTRREKPIILQRNNYPSIMHIVDHGSPIYTSSNSASSHSTPNSNPVFGSNLGSDKSMFYDSSNDKMNTCYNVSDLDDAFAKRQAAAEVLANTMHNSTTVKTRGGIMRSKSKSMIAACSVTPAAPKPVMAPEPIVEQKSVSIGAGAVIRQDVQQDTLGISGWRQEASSVIRLFFVFEAQFRQIAKGGVKDLAGTKTGFLKNLPVG